MESTNSSYASALSAFNGAQSRLIQDEDALSKLRLIAPQDGTITFIDGEVGDLAQGGMFSPTVLMNCLLYTSPSPRDLSTSRMPSSA